MQYYTTLHLNESKDQEKKHLYHIPIPFEREGKEPSITTPNMSVQASVHSGVGNGVGGPLPPPPTIIRLDTNPRVGTYNSSNFHHVSDFLHQSLD